MFINLIKRLKSTTGNSLAEFAVVTAMMSTLAVTAAPKFGAVGDGAKATSTIASIDKIMTVANNFYNKQVSEEGRGRFPGQTKYDEKVGGFDLPANTLTDAAVETYLETILNTQTTYEADLTDYVYVFSPAVDDEDAIAGEWMSFVGTTHQIDAGFDVDGADDFKAGFGNTGISSPFQDGAYIYLVIPGSGSGSDVQAPAMIIADSENPSELYKVLTP
jgi:hypothetical protein